MAGFHRAPEQSEIIEFLSRASSYPDAVEQVERHETHCSIVFLAGAYAYKLKRQVDFDFLDFSTLEKRYRAARNELKINRRYAPELYLGLVAVRIDATGRLHLSEDESDTTNVHEWLVKMRRFEQSAIYAQRARAGLIDHEDSRLLAQMVRQAHENSPILKRPQEALDTIMRTVRENQQFFQARPGLLPDGQAGVLLDAIAALSSRHAGLLCARAEQGFYRHCHGDLHLANIVRLEGHPTAFDAIEFDDDIATIDLLYDLAFLLMDLWRYGLHPAANRILDRYLRFADEAELQGLQLMPLFLGLRALVRLKVAALKQEQDGERRANREVLDYASLARDCLAFRKPLLIGIGGLSGTGKTTMARAIAPRIGRIPGALLLRSDVERKRMFGVGETDRLPTDAYRKENSDKVYERLWRKAALILRTGHSVIVDAVQAREAERRRLSEIAIASDADFHGIWLQADAPILKRRVDARRGDASDADSHVVEQQLSYNPGAIDWTTVDASLHREETARAILQHIGV